MEPIQWFIIGSIIIAALDQILDQSPWKSNNVLQLIMEGLKVVFRAGK
jgi:hypothetical protein